MIARTVRPIGWTSDVLLDEGLHYVTLHHVAETTGVPVRREPDKIDGWSWHAWDSPPEPLFAPIAALHATGWQPPR